MFFTNKLEDFFQNKCAVKGVVESLSKYYYFHMSWHDKTEEATEVTKQRWLNSQQTFYYNFLTTKKDKKE